MLSYWEQQSFTKYHCIVVGSGIVGLNTAIELRDRFPDKSILVIDRGWLPAGASTRNAGFAACGSLSELIDDFQHSSREQVYTLFEKRRKGLQRLRHRLGDAAIQYRSHGSHEFLFKRELSLLEHLPQINRDLKERIGLEPFRERRDKISEFGFDPSLVKSLVENICEGDINTGSMMDALLALAYSKGIRIAGGIYATHFEEGSNEVQIFFDDAIRHTTVALRCEQLLICTNAFTDQLLPKQDLQPGRGQVLITGPVAGLKIRGIFHFDKGYYYFREIDGRVLFGGGRNTDFETETTTDLELNRHIQQDLTEKLHTHILPGHSNVKVDMRWSGIMAFGSTKQPVVQRFGERVYGAFRMGGIGVALASEVAKEIVELVD